MIGTWVKVRGTGGYVNLDRVTLVEPYEYPVAGEWRPRIDGGNFVDVEEFASAEDCSEFIANLVHGYNPGV